MNEYSSCYIYIQPPASLFFSFLLIKREKRYVPLQCLFSLLSSAVAEPLKSPWRPGERIRSTGRLEKTRLEKSPSSAAPGKSRNLSCLRWRQKRERTRKRRRGIEQEILKKGNMNRSLALFPFYKNFFPKVFPFLLSSIHSPSLLPHPLLSLIKSRILLTTADCLSCVQGRRSFSS
jgi:hypothetical protein